jgi:hypothetical protein
MAFFQACRVVLLTVLMLVAAAPPVYAQEAGQTPGDLLLDLFGRGGNRGDVVRPGQAHTA